MDRMEIHLIRRNSPGHTVDYDTIKIEKWYFKSVFWKTRDAMGYEFYMVGLPCLPVLTLIQAERGCL